MASGEQESMRNALFHMPAARGHEGLMHAMGTLLEGNCVVLCRDGHAVLLDLTGLRAG